MAGEVAYLVGVIVEFLEMLVHEPRKNRVSIELSPDFWSVDTRY